MPQDFTAAQVLTAAQMDTLSGAVDGYATTATAAGTTTLTVASMFQQFFTGATTQTVVMPVASTCYIGWKIRIVNNSSGVVTVQSSGANTIYAVPAGGDVIFTCILASGTTAASWDYKNSTGVGNITNAQSYVATAESTTSATYAALATAQAVTVTTGTKVLVLLSMAAYSDNVTNNPRSFMSVAVSGATTTAASDAYSVMSRCVQASVLNGRVGVALFLTCTAGSNTFTLQFRQPDYTGTFSDRQMIVIDLGS